MNTRKKPEHMFYFYLMFGEKKMGQIKNKARASKKRKFSHVTTKTNIKMPQIFSFYHFYDA